MDRIIIFKEGMAVLKNTVESGTDNEDRKI